MELTNSRVSNGGLSDVLYYKTQKVPQPGCPGGTTTNQQTDRRSEIRHGEWFRMEYYQHWFAPIRRRINKKELWWNNNQQTDRKSEIRHGF
mmetsp:Transcript_73858/g.142849  ORF Transcript_73858/g.142849 Transcript_73858/m.142849 type:complete len:91 (+) Transcript_73858:761-1033(+)